MSETTSKKRKASLPLIIAGGVSSLVLALGMSPTFSAFTASIQNSVNTAGAGTLTMHEATTTGPVATCDSGMGAATCSTINKFGGNLNMFPGQIVTTGITITNTGSVPATSFSLAPSTTCTASDVPAATVHGTGNPCTLMTVVITSGVTPVYSGTLAGLASGGTINLAAPVAAGTVVPFTFVVTLPSSADNTMQGRQAAMTLTWAFGA
jgi:hypothetical protein